MIFVINRSEHPASENLKVRFARYIYGIMQSAALPAVMLFLAVSFFDANLYAQNTQSDCKQIINNMFDAIDKVRTLRFNLSSIERFGGARYVKANSTIKVNVSPYKVYYKDLQTGVEALWLQGQNNNEALINPNGFPYVNLRLDPYGKLMHKDSHQTVDRLGFSYIKTILYHSVNQFPNAYRDYIRQLDDTVFDGNICYKIEMTFPDFRYFTIMVQGNNETVNSIADKFYLNNYLVLKANGLSSYEDRLKAGTILSVPNMYAKTSIIIIRKDLNLPVYLRIYDDKGLFESYSFTNLQVNTDIPDAEFTESYPGYNF